MVPDKQMQDFMFLLDFSTGSVEVLNKGIKRGDRVRVIKGPLLGLEGELVRLKNHKRVIIRLDRGGLYCHVLHPEFIFGEDRVVQNNGKSFISRVV